MCQLLRVKNADELRLVLQDWQCLKIQMRFKSSGKKHRRSGGQQEAGWSEKYIYRAFEAFQK